VPTSTDPTPSPHWATTSPVDRPATPHQPRHPTRQFDPERAGTDLRGEYTYNAGKPTERGAHDHVGVYDQRDGKNYVGLSVPIGRLPAADAIELADLADAYGSGEVRLSRRQNPIVTDVPDGQLANLLNEPLLEKYRLEPNPFERGTMACTGTEFCSLALTETKARSARLIRWLGEHTDLPSDVQRIKIHYSGCTADCGQAMTADIGLQGMRARKDGEMVEALDVGVGGGIGEDPTFIEWVRQRVPADEVPGLIANLVEAFAPAARRGRRSASGSTPPATRRSSNSPSPRRSRGTRTPA